MTLEWSKWKNTVKTILYGDQPTAMAWIPFVRGNLLPTLHRCNSGLKQYFSGVQLLPDGSSYKLSSIFGQDIIEIWGVAAAVAQTQLFISIGNIAYSVDPQNVFTEVFQSGNDQPLYSVANPPATAAPEVTLTSYSDFTVFNNKTLAFTNRWARTQAFLPVREGEIDALASGTLINTAGYQGTFAAMNGKLYAADWQWFVNPDYTGYWQINIYVSADGIAWSNISTITSQNFGIDGNYAIQLCAYKNKLYLLDQFEEMYVSDDGASWASVAWPGYVSGNSNPALLRVVNGSLFACSAAGSGEYWAAIYQLSDSGTFSRVAVFPDSFIDGWASDENSSNYTVSGMAYLGKYYYASLTRYSDWCDGTEFDYVVRSLDAATWEVCYVTAQYDRIYALDAAYGKLYVGTAHDTKDDCTSTSSEWPGQTTASILCSSDGVTFSSIFSQQVADRTVVKDVITSLTEIGDFRSYYYVSLGPAFYDNVNFGPWEWIWYDPRDSNRYKRADGSYVQLFSGGGTPLYFPENVGILGGFGVSYDAGTPPGGTPDRSQLITPLMIWSITALINNYGTAPDGSLIELNLGMAYSGVTYDPGNPPTLTGVSVPNTVVTFPVPPEFTSVATTPLWWNADRWPSDMTVCIRSITTQ